MRCAAKSRSASQCTITPALPPSSSVTCFFGSRPLRYQPIAAEPVKRDLLEPVVARHAVGDLRAHRQHLVHALRQVGLGEELGEHAANRSGSRSAGFTTIGAPTASAGATLCATRFSGKLNGVMPSTGPIGNRRRMPERANRAPARCPGASPRPSPWRITSEAHRNVETARVASTVRPLQRLAALGARSARRSPRCVSASRWEM